MQALTGGAFDPSLGAWTGGPEPGQPSRRGSLEIDPGAFVVTVREGPAGLDLGAIGKGFALEGAEEGSGHSGAFKKGLLRRGL